MNFEINGKDFFKDGKRVKLISGAIHYFRCLPDMWGEVLGKLKALGCNCVETYCAWNLHEKTPTAFDFSGRLDIGKFIDTAHALGLMVIVRPGPYICSEWDFGGLPWWLQNDPEVKIRCANKKYLYYVDRYFDELFKHITPRLCTNGGPIIMLQCENEYGYYGDDKEYLNYLKQTFIRHGADVPLFTSDGTHMDNISDGTTDGCLSTLNFGSRVEESFAAHDIKYPDSPKMCMEMWTGWFDAWGNAEHKTNPAEAYARTVDDMLTRGSMNMYMFYGGTSFGFMSGANQYERYEPDVTSYDWDAPLSECADITPKYLALREVIKKYTGVEPSEIPQNRKKSAYGEVRLTKSCGIFDNLDKISHPVSLNVPVSMEECGIGYGYIAYRTSLNRDYESSTLRVEGLGDRAQVYINRTLVGILYINDSTELKISAKAGETLTILCENMGRTNFGPYMIRKKGIDGHCLIDGRVHFGWTAYPLPMDNLELLDFDKDFTESSAFYKGTLTIDEVCDTFLSLDNFTKGFVTINGFNLGRYWEIGPQRTLYVPSGILKSGENEIIVFDSDGIKGESIVKFTDTHLL